MTKRLLILGSGGMVGSSFPMYYEGIEIIRYSHKDLDIQDINKAEEVINQSKPDYLLNLAAYTNVERAEKEISECYLVNTYYATKIAELCNKYSIHYIGISTCGIFFNKLDYFDETCIDYHTTGVYYLSKLQLENNLKISCNNYTILRPNWMFGSLQDHKFVGKMIKKLTLNQDIKVASDVFGSYTYTKDLANTILELIEDDKMKTEKILHIVNKGTISRYESALEMKQILNSNSNIIPVENKVFQPNLKVSYNCNAQSKYIPLRTWQEAFKDFLLKG